MSMDSAPLFERANMPRFYVRTTVTTSRDFVVKVDTREEAEKIAQDLMIERAPAMHAEQTITAIRDEKDVNFSVAEAETNDSELRIVTLPNFLRQR